MFIDGESKIKSCLVQRAHVVFHRLLILIVQLHLQPPASHLEPIHLLDGLLSRCWIVITHKPDSFWFTILSHDFCGVNVAKSFEIVVELWFFHVDWEVEEEEVGTWRPLFPCGWLKIGNKVELWLNFETFGGENLNKRGNTLAPGGGGSNWLCLVL